MNSRRFVRLALFEPSIIRAVRACHFWASVQDTLTGQPVAEDTVMFAVAMCAPWTALQSFKYKVREQAAGLFDVQFSP